MSIIQNGPIVQQPAYFILKAVVSAETCDLLSEYALFRAKIKPNIKFNIDPLDHVHREYGDPVFDLLLEKLTPRIEHSLGCAVWSSLSFYYVYTAGNALQPHKDRGSCEWVAGLCIGADPEFKTTHNTWPLILKIGDKSEAIALEYGDILLFKGHDIEHWRNAFAGQWFVSAIFGFVEQNGPYAFLKYDQRQALGKPHIGMIRWALGCLKYKLLRKM